MKTILSTFLSLFLVVGSFAQDLSFNIHGNYTVAIKKQQLGGAKKISDLIPHYPSKWILDYVAVTLTTNHNGTSRIANGTGEILSAEQAQLLQLADLGTEVVINIAYKTKNSVTEKLEVRNIHYSVIVVPETEAKFPAGQQQLTQYLKNNAITKIDETRWKEMTTAVVTFTVNAVGKIANAQVTTTSGDEKIDQLLLETINQMPTWKPAEATNGSKVAQEFVFSVGKMGC